MDPDHEIIRRVRRLGEISVSEASTARAAERARRAVLRASSEKRQPAISGRTLLRWAASIAFVAVASVVVALIFLQAGRASVAFAQLQERIQQTRTIQLVETKKIEGKPEEVSHAIILANGLSRIDSANGSFSIHDVVNRKSMLVAADRKRAVIWHGLLPHVPTNLYEYIKNLHKDSLRELPSRTIDGVEAAGFAVTVRHEVLGETIETNVKIWVDPRTNLPIRMESADEGDGLTVLHDFRFDEEVDESLVRFEPPEGAVLEEHGYGPSTGPPSAAALEAVNRIRSGSSAESGGDGESVRLSVVLKLWENDKKDEAAKQLGAIDWSKPSALAGMPALSISEKDFISLGQQERQVVSEKAIELVQEIRAVQRHAYALAEKARASGDAQAAREYYDGVLRLAGELSGPEKLKLVQLLGQGLVASAAEKLAELE